MLTPLLRALRQLGDPAFRRVIGLSIAASLLLVAALTAGVAWLLVRLHLFETAWLDWAVDLLGGVAVLLLAWLLFPAVTLAVAGLLLDPVIAAVERRWYPDRPLSSGPPLWADIRSSLGMMLRVVLANLLALPFYLLLPGANLLLFWGLNGYLLGREYFELVALRHLGMEDTRKMRRRYRMSLFWAGLLIAFLSSLPIVNLLVPVIATAFMVHLFEQLGQRAERVAGGPADVRR